MKNTDKTRTWNARSPHGSGQGLVIEEETGRNIAVTYDEKDRHIVAAAPDLLAALHNALAFVNDGQLVGHRPGGPGTPFVNREMVLNAARAALAKARGEA